MRGGRVRLLTAVGDDADGHYLANIAPGLLLDGCVVKEARTPTYAAVLDAKGECLLGLGDMGLHNHITPQMVDNHIEVLEQAPLVVMDGNIPEGTMDHVMRLCNSMEKPVFFEPTDRRKAVKALKNKYHLTYASPNLSELRAMAQFLKPDIKGTTLNGIEEVLRLSAIVSQHINFIIVTLGPKGVVTVGNSLGTIQAQFYPVNALSTVENVSGAGDCFASGFLHGIISGKSQSLCIAMGLQAAKCALQTKYTVPNDIRFEGSQENTNYIQLDIGSEMKGQSLAKKSVIKK